MILLFDYGINKKIQPFHQAAGKAKQSGIGTIIYCVRWHGSSDNFDTQNDNIINHAVKIHSKIPILNAH